MEPQDPLQKELLALLMIERSRSVSMDEFSKVMSEVLDDTMLKVLKASEPMKMGEARAILASVKEQLIDVYGDLPDWIRLDEEYAAELMGNTSGAAMATTAAAVDEGLVAVSFSKLNKTQIDTLLSPNRQLGTTGFTLNDMVNDLHTSTVKRTRQILAKGVTAKQTPSEITRSLQNLWGDTTRHRADAVVRTAMIDAADVARFESDKQFQSVIIGYQPVAIMDNRTSPICIELHLVEYKRQKGQSLSALWKSIPDKPRRHPRCRTWLRKMIKGEDDVFEELDRPAVIWDKKGETLNAKGKPKGRVKHRDGSESMRLSAKDATVKRLPADSTFQEFFNTLTVKQQGSIVGVRKAKLMRSGDLSLSQVLKSQRDGGVRYLRNDEIVKILDDS